MFLQDATNTFMKKLSDAACIFIKNREYFYKNRKYFYNKPGGRLI